MIDATMWVWSGREDGDIFDACVEVALSDTDEVALYVRPNGAGRDQSIYLTRFHAGRLAQALEAATKGET